MPKSLNHKDHYAYARWLKDNEYIEQKEAIDENELKEEDKTKKPCFECQLKEYKLQPPLKHGELPDRFKQYELFQGYGERVHPFYRTTSEVYGSKKPNELTTHKKHFGMNLHFSTKHLLHGNYRNQSFNL